MSDVIDVNIYRADFEVYWQDEVELNLDMELMYIKSGEAEIQNYVDTVSKPEINDYIETNAQPLVSQIVEEIAEPTVAAYIEDTVKPELDEYAEGLKPELQVYVTQASNYADNSQASATASEASAAAALASANNAGQSATSAQSSANNAASSKNAAESSATSASNYANNAEIWAEGTDSQVQALGGSKSAKGWANSIDDSVVHKTGNEAVNGTKAFTVTPILNSELHLVNTSGMAPDNPPSQTTSCGTLRWTVKGTKGSTAAYGGGQELWRMQPIINSIGNFYVTTSYLYGSGARPVIWQFGCDADGNNPYFTVPTPAATDNSKKAATTAWVNSFISNLTSTVGSGYVYIGNLLIQWGFDSVNTRSTLVFPKPFANTDYSIVLTGVASETSGTSDWHVKSTSGSTQKKTTSVVIVGSISTALDYSWFAIGKGA